MWSTKGGDRAYYIRNTQSVWQICEEKEIKKVVKKKLLAFMRARSSGGFEFEDSSSIPSINVQDPFHYVPPLPDSHNPP